MDDTLGFTERSKIILEEDWKTDFNSERFIEGSFTQLAFREQSLQIMQQKKQIDRRPKIVASLIEKLAFYQIITTSFKNICFIYTSSDLNTIIWMYVFNVFFKNLPCIYTHLFLGLYAPRFHLFVSKMVPIMHVSKFVLILVAILEVIYMMHLILSYFRYFINGLFYKIPWNTCKYESLIIVGNISINCYQLLDFKKKIENETVSKEGYAYTVSSSDERFNLVQLLYYAEHVGNESSVEKIVLLIVIFALIWLHTAIWHNQLFKNLIWKILARSHISLITMCACVFVHVLTSYESPNIKTIDSDSSTRDDLIQADLWMLSESMLAPPVAHVLSSSDATGTKPSLDSAVIVFSNSLLYLFRNLNAHLLQIFCENYVKVPIQLTGFAVNPVFLTWPIYFAMIPWGDFFVLVFFLLISVSEFCTVVLICQFILEVMICEWHLRPWFAACICYLLTIFCNWFDFQYNAATYFMHMCLKGSIVIIEAIVLYWIYPLGRLADDITFHYGIPPNKLRMLSLSITPLYILVKLYRLFQIIINCAVPLAPQTFYIASTFTISVYAFGVIYAIYFYIVKHKCSWDQLFKPIPEWGPVDFTTRKLRKQFDSREYIASEAPRELSRHLTEKAQSKVYKLDLNYDYGFHQSFKNAQLFSKGTNTKRVSKGQL